MYKIIVDPNIKKFLKKHPELIKRFFESMNIIQKKPFQNSCDIKQLKGKENHRRLRIGKYRFLYEIKKNEILIYVYDANSRGKIYK